MQKNALNYCIISLRQAIFFISRNYSNDGDYNMENANQMDLDVFHFNKDKKSFDDFSYQNGGVFWYASDICKFLGYDSMHSFRNVINRAIAACTSLNINVIENFKQEGRVIDGKSISDFKLSRFACYLVSMNGDPKKSAVAKAQIYFAALAETFRNSIEAAENVERVLIRDEISDREKSLSEAVDKRGIESFPLFRNAGYRGMYNMNLNDLKKVKGLNEKNFNRSLLDFMGKTELAANLFRVTQTESKIRNENVTGQKPLEKAAELVGQKVRNTMMEISHTKPEELTLEEDIKNVAKHLKDTNKKLKQIDKK
jgi:DNA-damage-inducible protein D